MLKSISLYERGFLGSRAPWKPGRRGPQVSLGTQGPWAPRDQGAELMGSLGTQGPRAPWEGPEAHQFFIREGKEGENKTGTGPEPEPGLGLEPEPVPHFPGKDVESATGDRTGTGT